MKKHLVILTAITVLFCLGCSSSKTAVIESMPIRQHPDNPHIFLWQGKPKVFIASGEHYGALINKDFKYDIYFQTLQKAGLQHTRLFLGDYLEGPNAFDGILVGVNSLEPALGSFICPWARSSEPGFARGGNKFDLDQWDTGYFKRLHLLFLEAEKNNVTIEAMLFFVGPSWDIMPLNPSNNINKTEQVGADGYLVKRAGSKMQTYQEAYVRKMVRELNQYNHFIWNASNEPWLNNAVGLNNVKPEWLGIEMTNETKAFVQQVAHWIKDEEAKLPKKHLIGVDITNEGHLIKQSDLESYYKDFQILNVHYDSHAKSLDLNYHRTDKIITFNETGLTDSTYDPRYRTDGWYYCMAGGGLYGNLDYTFYTNGHENGTFNPIFPGWYKGSGDQKVKYQLGILQKFMDSLPLEKMFRDTVVCSDKNARVISWKGNVYAAFFRGDGIVSTDFELLPGTYKSEWIDILTGAVRDVETFTHTGGKKSIKSHQLSGGGGALRVYKTK